MPKTKQIRSGDQFRGAIMALFLEPHNTNRSIQYNHVVIYGGKMEEAGGKKFYQPTFGGENSIILLENGSIVETISDEDLTEAYAKIKAFISL